MTDLNLEQEDEKDTLGEKLSDLNLEQEEKEDSSDVDDGDLIGSEVK